jgi:hypothetical protein
MSSVMSALSARSELTTWFWSSSCQMKTCSGDFIEDDFRREKRLRIARHDLVLHAVVFLPALGHDRGDEPEIEQAAHRGNEQHRRDDRRKTHARGLDGQQLAIRRHAPEDDQHGRQQAGGQRQREGERDEQQDELHADPDRQAINHRLHHLDHVEGDEKKGEYADDGRRHEQQFAVDVIVDERHGAESGPHTRVGHAPSDRKSASGETLFPQSGTSKRSGYWRGNP